MFEEILDEHKDANGYSLDTELTADDWQKLVGAVQAAGRARRAASRFRRIRRSSSGARSARCSALDECRANTYRRLQQHSRRLGHRGQRAGHGVRQYGRDDSATGVAFTRNPSTGEKTLYGEFLINAQGEDVVAGIRTPQAITEAARKEAGSDKPSLKSAMPAAFAELTRIYGALEKHYRDMQDHRVHHRARQALDAADAHRQAHGQGGAQDRRRYGERRTDHARTKR